MNVKANRITLPLVVIALSFFAVPAAASASGSSGSLTQKAGIEACISETGTGGSCTDGVGLDFAVSITVSPDGRSAYVASAITDAVAVFDRNTTTGALTQKAGTDACISESGTGGSCMDGVALDGAQSVTVSPDGKSVYVTSPNSDSVAVLDRDTTTGALTQKAGLEACVSETGAGPCTDGVALDFAQSVTVSPDGKSVYVTSSNSDAVAVFDRNTTTGALTQKAGLEACISETGAGPCTDGVALDFAVSITVSPDGRSAYVASGSSDAIAVFDRNTTTGALTQKAGTDACISESGTGGACANGVALDGARSVTVSPDGSSAYVASPFSDAVAVFDRNTTTGALTQKAGLEACISETGAGPCTDGVALDFAVSITVSPDGKSVYVTSSNSDSVAVLDRDTTTGALTQKAGLEACISETGAGPCTDGVALDFASSVTVSPDGRSAYVASRSSDAVAVFDREVPPDTTIDSGPSGPTGDSTPTFEFSSSESGSTFECRLYPRGITPPAFVACSGPGDTHTPPAALFEGEYAFEVRATDAVGNTDPSPASRIFTVDTTPPDTTIDTGPSGTTGDATPSFEFSSESNATFECRVDADVFSSCSSPETVAELTDGTHTFEVRASDAVGNTDPSPAARTFTVDATPPDTQIVSGPSGTIATDEATFTFSGDPASDTAKVQCRIDSEPFADCSGPGAFHLASGLSDGPHTFEARAEDWVGNQDQSPATRTFTVDTTPPDTQIDSGPSGTTGDATPSFEFSSEPGATFECRVDTDTFGSCSSPENVAALTDGPHTFAVRATDSVGNTNPNPATRSFTVDTTPPVTIVFVTPTLTVRTDEASYEFGVLPGEEPAEIQCRIDDQPFEVCDSPAKYPELTDAQYSKTWTGLSEGPHTAEFRSEDAVGNQEQSPATHTFKVDTTPLDTTIDTGPSGTVTTDEVSFTFSGDPASYTTKVQCRIDSEPFEDCTSPKTFTGLSDGPHTAAFRAEDWVGNQDQSPATRTFTVDTTPPDTQIDSGPTGTINANEATFTFSGTPAADTAKIQCRIDSEPFADCTSPKTFSGLSDGPHTATFRAEDAVGNQDPTSATRSFTVDTTVDPPVVDPPVVDPPVDPSVGKAKIGKVKVKGPAKVKKGKKATYKAKVTNSGNIDASGVKLQVKGKGVKAKKNVGTIAAGKSKTVKIRLKFKKPGKVRTTFKLTSSNAGGKTVKKKIKVKK